MLENLTLFALAHLKSRRKIIMFKKCKANCQANDNLYIRNNVFYYMVEKPRLNGKRRYFIKSLHTTNYYEALEKAKQMKKELDLNQKSAKELLSEAHYLMDQIVYEDCFYNVETGDGRVISTKTKRISAKTDLNVIQNLFNVITCLTSIKNMTDAEKTEMVEIITKIVNAKFDAGFTELKDLLLNLQVNSGSGNGNPPQTESIGDILSSWIKSLSNCETEIQRKENILKKMIDWAGLKLTDKYTDFYKEEVIQKINQSIKSMTDVKGDTRCKYARYLRDFIQHAQDVNPSYQTNLIKFITKFDKTASIDIDGHMPFTEEQLKLIFDTKNNFFAKREDQFWFAIIALFTGARRNAATTLQYADIMECNGIKCIQFKENHPIKQLKNDESERFVPIAKQMLDLGFWEYIQKRKTKFNASDTDFIFPNCQRKKDNKFDTNIVQKGFIKHIQKLGIKIPGGEKYDFHSLRNNASLRLQDVNVQPSYINKIIGWKGKTTMEQHYSKRRLSEIKPEADKLKYDFLQTEFDYWKEVMSKK